MSLATRCPACGTIFRVVQDQLKVSEGWVRCGQCHEVFHGIEALFDLDSDPAVAARRAAARATSASAPIPFPTPSSPPPAPSPIAIPARPAVSPPPAGAQGLSTFGAPDHPPAAPATRPGYTGFTPATRPLPPAPQAPAPQASQPAPAPTSFSPVATRGTIAPRFAARLAEEAARAQSLTPGAIPAAFPPPAAPQAPAPFGGALGLPSATGWQPAAAPAAVVVPEPAAPPEPAPEPPAMYIPPSLLARRPVVEPPPEPAPAETPSTPRTTSTAADLADEFAAPAPESVPAFAVAPKPAPDIGGPTTPSQPADADADDARAGPPTLASMLPEDAGDWPPRKKKAGKGTDTPGTEVALVDKTKDPRFLREARSGARWRKPWVRAVLSVALLLLVVAAAGQVAWPQRDTLAARWPATLPAWQWLCEQADCRIEAPRAIASLALDGSSLTRTDTEHVLLFAADLHNRAEHAVRMPSFDVTFMDLNGEIVSRKVLTPEQLGIHQDALPAEGELHVHARLQVGTLAASGFQADLFYP
jgi:predicted Zn finger-like uncharacterized protein